MAARDERLYRLLQLKAERAAGPAATLKAFRRAIDSATKTRGFVDWQEAGAYAADLDQMTDSLQELLTADSAALLIGLAERAIERIEHAMEQVDDSSGEVGGVLARIGELHLAACELAQPDPEQLAERLFRYEMTCPFETYRNSASVYRNALGTTGLQRFRELATAEWGKVQPKGADACVAGDEIGLAHIRSSSRQAGMSCARICSLPVIERNRPKPAGQSPLKRTFNF